MAKKANQNGKGANLGFEEKLCAAADKLRGHMDAAEYTLRAVALELVETVRRNTTIDWTVKKGVRAKLRTIVKKILRKYGYPPDKQEKATQTVLQQA